METFMNKRDIITEEKHVNYKNITDLSYVYDTFDKGYVALFNKGKWLGYCQIWYDNDGVYVNGKAREYICLNYVITYLDTLRYGE